MEEWNKVKDFYDSYKLNTENTYNNHKLNILCLADDDDIDTGETTDYSPDPGIGSSWDIEDPDPDNKYSK